MQPDQVENCLSLFRVEVEPRKKRVRQFNALACMLSGAPRLAGVVQEQSEKKQVEPVDFRQQLRQALFVVVRRLAEGMHIVDRQEGMFVYGVSVIAVADDQGINPVELGDQHL